MARIFPIFSGSRGNCTYVGSGNGGLLIDSGAGAKRIIESLKQNDISPEEIKAILITHEHHDHVSGLKALINALNIPVYASEQTLAALINSDKIAKSTPLNVITNTVEIHDILVKRFETSHDCAGSSGYVFSLRDNTKIAVCTDLGSVTQTVRDALLGCNVVMLESNHDINLLQNGPYPLQLKQRIASDSGHLSNTCCARELPALVNSGATQFILAHLSQDNNNPNIAHSCATATLLDNKMYENRDYMLYIASQNYNKMIIC
ncbi:MAG: MBL fold metallo-hydrolase [bacterium]|nr:MBL fold metallo-hydrolase [bacterium]